MYMYLAQYRHYTSQVHCQSLKPLEKDESLRDMLGHGLVSGYLTVKPAESARLLSISEEERPLWLLERY
ncbi:hypothetical protein N7489_005534 [Penicillium chrysogenum]|jgi:glutamine synthetase|uniref:Uncharacterized protein n=1 Tax=Penicillium chrysogenum TaxID=5076 RepID=A0ABQ8WRT1_PENCH|nr:uncharacterized protein N7489_005534 [Penicillium chrysogenum]KAJ5245438.1 hypothetical protein N7489_005534 [Penicillium chrysogenum]KAJ5274470.1 hypothetical protein N7505_003015 [Penicillium chrysogenum]KAJ5284966.1 hypothetical protein N7524_000272 [Penicillium chrysogenum]KAJ6156190.1 hypothetical protein N7497_005075 [Penicillium chrysogenum]